MRTPEFETFVSFVKRHVNIIMTAAATPVLAGFFGLVQPPGSQENGRFPATMTAIVCALVLLALFWRRYAIVNRSSDKWLVGGILIAVAGLGLLGWYHSMVPSPTTQPTFLEVLLYVIGFPMFSAGAAIVFLYGFVEMEERRVTFNQIVGRLENVHVKHLEVIARAFECANSASLDGRVRVPEKVRKAFKESSWNVILEASERMQNLSKGHLEIWGPNMDKVYRSFVEAIRKSFIAVSRDDLDFWTKPYSGTYLSLNKYLIERDCVVERIFLVPQQKRIEKAHRKALIDQIDRRIRVRIGNLEELAVLGIEDQQLDFGLFDDFAVSFFRFMHGRLFRVTVDQKEYRRYKDILDRVVTLCATVPGKTSGDAALFESSDDLDAWLREREDQQKKLREPVGA